MPLDSEYAAKIKAAVHKNFANQLKFTQDIVRYGGQRGDEQEAQEEMFRQYERRGYNPVKIELDESVLSQHFGSGKVSAQHSKVPSVVAIHEPKSSEAQGKSLILNGHIDIVPIGPVDLWTGEPYSGHVDGDWLYGRGAGDMRAGLVANLFALDALTAIGMQPASKVTLQSVPEEESTGNGTMVTHLAGYTADAVLIPEPTQERLVRANVGVIWFQVEVVGKPVHVMQMKEGSNAIESIWKLVAGLRELEKEMNEQKKGKLYFDHMDHPINLNVAKIEGGDWASSVPAWCRIDCRVALYPGVTAQEVARQLEDTIQRVSKTDAFLSNFPPKVIYNGFFAEGYVLEPGSTAEKILEGAHKEITGQALGEETFPAYVDTRIFSLYQNIPALCYGPVSESIHGFDERVSIASIERVTTAIALFIAEWCGLEKIV